MAKSSEILTLLQYAFVESIFRDEWFHRYFYLTGGTALAAFHLFHRYSDDLDFFSHGVSLAGIPQLFQAVGKGLGESVQIVQETPGFLRFQIGASLKVDVVADTDFRVGAPEWIEDVRVDSLKNIAVNKVCAVLGRLDLKDYVDLFFLLKEKEFDIFELLKLGREKDGGLDPFVWASLLADIETLTILPRMIKPITLQELIRFFLELRAKIVDSLNPNLLR